MIIQCKSCSQKFLVKDEDIPPEGRMVQCSNCSQKWFQAPIIVQSPIKSDVDNRLNEFKELNNSQDWFSELCFCILTANSKAATDFSKAANTTSSSDLSSGHAKNKAFSSLLRLAL